MYANVISDGGDPPDEDWECHGAVPDYIRPSTIDLPECDPEFLDIVEIYKDSDFKQPLACASSNGGKEGWYSPFLYRLSESK